MIERYSLRNFRNFEGLDLEINQGLNILVGPNGAGKTNFLEGLYFGATLRRLPESSLAQLFRNGEDFFKIVLAIPSAHLEMLYQKTAEHYEREIKINHQAAPRQQYTAALPMVSFLPSDLQLLTGSPSRRRRYLNETLSAVSSEYRHAATNYERALRHRNEVLHQLKEGRTTADNIAVWDEQLAEYGAYLGKQHSELVEYINNHIPEALLKLSPELTSLRFVYQNTADFSKAGFLTTLQQTQKRDQQHETTSIGPHRDDLAVLWNNEPVAGFLSRGQQRGIVLGLKMIEKRFLADRRPGSSPVLLLDDVFSEFDGLHQKNLLGLLKEFRQVFITTTHIEEVKFFLPPSAQIYAVSEGKIERNV